MPAEPIQPTTVDGSPFVPRSHWQQGCNDGKAGLPHLPPFPPQYGHSREAVQRSLARAGYSNGHAFGRELAGLPTL